MDIKTETKELKCPHCGGNMELVEEENLIKCPYCGYSELYEEEETAEEEARREGMSSYARRAGMHRADEEHMKRMNRKAKVPKLIVLIVIILIFAVIIFNVVRNMGGGENSILNGVTYEGTIETPFDYCKVSFSGNDGSGKISINKN